AGFGRGPGRNDLESAASIRRGCGIVGRTRDRRNPGKRLARVSVSNERREVGASGAADPYDETARVQHLRGVREECLEPADIGDATELGTQRGGLSKRWVGLRGFSTGVSRRYRWTLLFRILVSLERQISGGLKRHRRLFGQ